MSGIKKYQQWPAEPHLLVIDCDVKKAHTMAETMLEIFPHLEVREISDDIAFQNIKDIVIAALPDILVIGDLSNFKPHPDFDNSTGRIAILTISYNWNVVVVRWSANDRKLVTPSIGVDVYYDDFLSRGYLRDQILSIDAEE